MHKRLTHTSVNITAFCNGKVLLLKRGANVSVDANKVNNIGGRVDPGETTLNAAWREFMEETPYVIEKGDLTFKGYGHVHGGYSKDWIMSFFEVHLPDDTDMTLIDGFVVDGHKDMPLFREDPKKVLEHDCVDDLYYLWDAITDRGKQFYFNGRINDDLKVAEWNLDVL